MSLLKPRVRTWGWSAPPKNLLDCFIFGRVGTLQRATWRISAIPGLCPVLRAQLPGKYLDHNLSVENSPQGACREYAISRLWLLY